MYQTADEVLQWVPHTEEEKDLVRKQMHRLLETSHFKNSRRYPALFRFIVEEALEGRGAHLKERVLGNKVFDRPADYDTASDPIVRVTIAEIRKRIAQYYHEEAHDSEMRIELLPGHYAPEFRLRRPVLERPSAPAPIAIAVQIPDTLPLVHEVLAAPQETRGSHKPLWAALAMTLAVTLLAVCYWRWRNPPALDEFWAPVIKAHGVVTFCLPNGAGKNLGMAAIVPEMNPTNETAPAGKVVKTPTFLDHESLGENVVFSDVLGALPISNLIARENRESRFRLNISTTLNDLRQGPVVLIGGMDNQWTLRAIAPLRFHFAGDNTQETFWIEDNADPNSKTWTLSLKTQYAKVTHDYAIIARIHDETTGEPEVIVAGIGMSGTAAAGEFLVDPNQLTQLREKVGRGFRDRDFEAILSTDVVDGIAGMPRILRVAVW